MNNESHLKRFFMKTYNDIDMYYGYLKGDVFVDRNIYSKWASTLERRNELFAHILKQCDRVRFDDKIIESKLSNNSCVSQHFVNKAITNISEFQKFKIEKKNLGDSANHYICNGYFEDTLEQIYNVLNNGSFTVGICTEKKTELFRSVVAHYNQLKDFLLKNGYNTASIQTNVSANNRVYLLMYDHKIKKRNK